MRSTLATRLAGRATRTPAVAPLLPAERHSSCPLASPLLALPRRAGERRVGQGSGPMLALMMMRGEEREVDCFAHGRVAGMIGMEVIPGQLGELAVGHVFRLHVA